LSGLTFGLTERNPHLCSQDTAGQERFHALGPIYYRDADGALLVYDITDVDSFNRVKNWVKELRKMLGSEIPIIIAGNKADLEKTRTVAIEEAQRWAIKLGLNQLVVGSVSALCSRWSIFFFFCVRSYAQSVNASYVETSAKLNKGVDQLFLDLTKGD
jgi:Ras-related protein Rab-21